eukprot:7161967-Lingulodinium_polyedra.AAC.1
MDHLGRHGCTAAVWTVLATQYGDRVAKARRVLAAVRAGAARGEAALERARATLQGEQQSEAEALAPCLLPVEALEEHVWVPPSAGEL